MNPRQYLIPFIAIHEHKRLITTQCENSLQPLKMQICVPRYVCCVKVWSSFFLLGGGDGLNAYILFCLKLFRMMQICLLKHIKYREAQHHKASYFVHGENFYSDYLSPKKRVNTYLCLRETKTKKYKILFIFFKLSILDT